MNKFTKKMMGILTVGTAAFMMAGCSVAKNSNSSGTHQDKDTVKIGVKWNYLARLQVTEMPRNREFS